MKNTKLIGLVALLVVVVLVVSVVIATSADATLKNDVMNKVDQNASDLAALKAQLAKLGISLDKVEELLKDLQDNNINGDEFDEVSPLAYTTWAELETVFNAEKAKDADGSDTRKLYNGYKAKVDAISAKAYYLVFRASTKEALEAIKEDVLAQIKAIPTRVKEYENLVAAIEKDDVTVDDKANFASIIDAKMYEYTPDLYEGKDAAEKQAAKKVLDDRYTAAFGKYKTAEAKKYDEMVAALPEAEKLTIEEADIKALTDVETQYTYVLSLGVAAADVKASYDKYVTLDTIRDTYLTIKNTANTFNATIDGYFTGVTFGLNQTTLDQLVKLEKALKDELAAVKTNHSIELVEGLVNKYVRGFFDPDNKVATYRTNYNKLADDLKTLATKYVDAVNTLKDKKIYTDLDAANTAAWTAWSAIHGAFGKATVTAADVDEFLEDTTKTVENAFNSHNTISGKLHTVKTNIEALRKYLEEEIHTVVCQKPTEHTGSVTCNCTTRSTDYNANLDLATIQTKVDKYLKTLLEDDLKLTEEVIGTELLAKLKAAYVYAAEEAVNDQFKKVSGDQAFAKVQLNKALEAISVENLTFATVYDETAKTWDWAEGYKTLKANLVTWTSAAYFSQNNTNNKI